MRSQRLLPLFTVLVASVALSSRAANDIEPSKEYYSVIRAPAPIVLDGSLAEWSEIPVLADPKFSVPKNSGSAGTYVLFEEYGGGTWTGPDDQTSAVQVAYDANNVYFGFIVTDDYHENSANSAWNGDSIQLMIATEDRTAQVALYNYALGGTENGGLGATIAQTEAGPGGTEAVITRNSATKRTTYEIKLPKAALGLENLTGGTKFGLGMAINDGDLATPGQRGWGGLGAHSIVFGKSPGQTALMTLAAPPAPTNDIEPGKETYSVTSAPKAIVLDGSLSEWSGIPVLADPKFSVPKGSGAAGTGNYVLFEEYAGGTWTGPDDQTSAVQVAYDSDNIYFGFVVTDDYHENSANSAWNGDSIQLMIASADRTAQVALYNYALGGTDNGGLGGTIAQHEAGPGGTEAVITRNSATKRTTYEIKLPKAALGLENLTGGTTFGLGMAINDGDLATPGQRGWGGLGAHSIVFGKTPSQTALMTLESYNDIEAGKERYTATAATRGIALDGSLSEWIGVPVLADPKFSIPKNSGAAGTGSYVLFEEYAGGTWTGPNDQTSAVQIVYDANNVYFGFVVTDDYHENSANSAWNGDSIQLMIASADRTAQVALYNYALGGTESALGGIIAQHEAGPGGTEAVVLRDTLNKKTIYEIKLPAAALGLNAPLTAGTKFGLGMAINDGDQATPGQRGWGGLGAHSIVFGKSPSQTAEITLGTSSSSAALFFLAAVNPSINTFTFRASDVGSSIVYATSAKLKIDGQLVLLVAGTKVLDATDFTYTSVKPFAAGNHTYSIEVRDTSNQLVTDSGTFTSPGFSVLAAGQRAVSVDLTKPGFIWRVFQNDEAHLDPLTPTEYLADAELALDGQYIYANEVVANWADYTKVGVALEAGVLDGFAYRFQIPGVVSFGDLDMPGVPGISGLDGAINGIDAEILTFIEMPAGIITLGVDMGPLHSYGNDFKAEAGFINNADSSPFAPTPLGQSLPVQSRVTLMRIYVETAGIYPVRIVYQKRGGGVFVQLFSVNANGDKVNVNEPETGLRAFRAGVVPIGINNPAKLTVSSAGGKINVSWTNGGTLQSSPILGAGAVWTDVGGATPASITPAGSALFLRVKN